MSENSSPVQAFVSEHKWKLVGAAVAALGLGIYLSTRKGETKAEEKPVEAPAEKTEAHTETQTEAATATEEATVTEEATTEVTTTKDTEVTAPVAVETKVAPAPVTKEVTVEVKKDDGELSYDNLCAMFRDMIETMPAIMFTLSQECQQMMQQRMTEDVITQYAESQYKLRLEQAHMKLLEKYNTTEEASEVACQKYAEDETFKALLKKLENLNRSMTGDFDQDAMNELPSFLTESKVVEIFTDIMHCVTECLVQAMTETHAATGSLDDMETKQRFTGLIGDRKAAIFVKHGITEPQLDIALQKFSQSGTVVQAIMGLQQEQQQTLGKVRSQLGGSPY